jgi:release factor glutamine methyltransferase
VTGAAHYGGVTRDRTRGELVAELAEVVGAPHEARWIVDEALGLGRVLGQPDVPAGALDAGVVTAARAMAARRAAGEPLQYVFGHWPFRSLDLVVDRRVLIPRPETEQVVEVALAAARRLAAEDDDGSGLIVVDAGTGSGAIALALAVELGAAVAGQVWATDASPDALAVAAVNLASLRADAPARPVAPVLLVQGSWLDALPDSLRGRVDLVVSNPPYVSEDEWAGLAPDVRHEPRAALVAGAGSDGTPGLADVEAVLTQAAAWLRPGGSVVVELAPDQAEMAVDLAGRIGLAGAGVERDLAGRQRALRANATAGGG